MWKRKFSTLNFDREQRTRNIFQGFKKHFFWSVPADYKNISQHLDVVVGVFPTFINEKSTAANDNNNNNRLF